MRTNCTLVPFLAHCSQAYLFVLTADTSRLISYYSYYYYYYYYY